MRRVLVLSLCAGLSWFGCQCGPASGVDGDGGSGAGAGGGSGAGSGGSGGSGAGSGGAGGGGMFDRDASCASISQQATLGSRPVDIIFVIDNSGSMTAEITGVEQNINQNFAAIIGASGLDYRVIMLSTHGSATATQSICISAPLSGATTCSPPPARPVNTARFFHYSTEIGSTNSFRKILDTYNVADPNGAAPQGWSQWLRPNSMKTFIEITDDNQTASTDYLAFENQLFQKMPAVFGTAASRNYVFHSIVGVAAKANPADAYQPAEALVTGLCPSAVNAGTQYQNLSKVTGGLRFPVCDPSKYDTVFRTVAQGVVASAGVACEFDMPTPPMGYTISNRIYIEYTPGGGGAAQVFNQVANAAACAGNSFYVANQKVYLCTDTCNAVKADMTAKLGVFFTCEAGIN